MLGAIPGVLIGARISSSAPDHIIRPILIVVLLASGAKLLEASDGFILGFVGLAIVVGAVVAGTSAYRRRRASVADASATAA